jgi:DNA-binding FadR family transcriptional regulator
MPFAAARYGLPRVKASQAIAAEYRQLIARGELKAGDPLPVESELVDRLGASKGVVREALRILETEGLIEVRRGLGGGPRVRHPSITDAAMSMGVYLQIGDVPVVDVWVARDRIIAAAVERLAECGSEGLGQLEASVAELERRIGDFDAYYPQLIDAAETAVQVAGNATEYMLVVALRHVIAVELDAATRAVGDQVQEAVEAERFVTTAWRDVLRHIRAGHPTAARRAYERQADLVRDGLADRMGDATVVDVFGP